MALPLKSCRMGQDSKLTAAPKTKGRGPTDRTARLWGEAGLRNMPGLETLQRASRYSAMLEVWLFPPLNLKALSSPLRWKPFLLFQEFV